MSLPRPESTCGTHYLSIPWLPFLWTLPKSRSAIGLVDRGAAAPPNQGLRVPKAPNLMLELSDHLRDFFSSPLSCLLSLFFYFCFPLTRILHLGWQVSSNYL